MARIGVYVCHCGGNISEVIDVKEVAAFAGEKSDVVIAKDETHMCSDVGQQLILNDIKEHKLDKVVIAACSPQFQGATFMRTVESAGLSPYVMEMANIREQCSWPHFDFPKDATEKAKDLTDMAIAKARLDESLKKKMMPIGKRVLIVGGGIAGIQAALDLGDAGFKVYLVEKDPSIGGHMTQLSRTFPTEDCAACILSPKMADVPVNPNIELLTYSEVKNIEGFLGNYEVRIEKKPTYVDPAKCTCCDDCVDVCPAKVPNEYEEGLTTRKAIYLPNPIAVPHSYVIDVESCLGQVPLACTKCFDVCEPGAINYDQYAEEINITVDTIIMATGFEIFDATQKAVYGFGKYENVITAMDMERLIVHGAEGSPLRATGNRIAFIQCVGSRDEQVGNENCSRICCMYATKLSQLLKRSDPKRDIYVFYTDLRAYGKGFEEYYKRAQGDGVKFIRGRVAEVIENSKTKKLTLKVEDTLTRNIIESEFDLVVLSVGLRPNGGTDKVANMLRISKSPDGFLQEAHPKFKPVDTLTDGVFLAGTVQGPKDIPDTVAQASAASSRAIRLMNQGEFALDPIMAFVHEDLCDGCKLCVEHCPTDAITVSSGIASVNEALCKGCGSCLAACPKDALDLHVYTNDQVLAEIKSVLKSKKKEQSRFLVFADDMTAYRLSDNVGIAKMSYSIDSRIIRIPSCSRITPKLMLEALKAGADGILLGESEEKSSPFPDAISTINSNISKVKQILRKNEIEEERIRFVQFVTVMLGGFVNNMNGLGDYLKKVRPISDKKRKKLGIRN
ncbi:MAG: FAD-dependent oxidoreductase [Candidatus Cloacimonetes bacterium]|nr:FAD-dependent oxidoreductase [Candidatus Cloacimonadota bacterium]